MRVYVTDLPLVLLATEIVSRVAEHLGAGDDSRELPGWGVIGDEGALWSTRGHIYGDVGESSEVYSTSGLMANLTSRAHEEVPRTVLIAKFYCTVLCFLRRKNALFPRNPSHRPSS